MAPWSIVSPASRGIGFALARRVLQTTKAPLVVTARSELENTKKKLLYGLNVDESRLTMLEVDVLGMFPLSTCDVVLTRVETNRQLPMLLRLARKNSHLLRTSYS